MYENVYGDQAGNNAGEYLAVDRNNGDVMVFADSDTLGGAFGFLKLTGTKNRALTHCFHYLTSLMSAIEQQ